jgi:predicted permease
MLPRWFRRKRWDRERASELDSYIETETQDNIARGMSPEDARAAARRKLGNTTLVREEIYRMNTLSLIDSLWQDLRYAARVLRLNLGFTLVAIASLALGIGANTAIFQLLDSVRLRTLPVSHPEQLAEIRIANMEGARGNFNRYPGLTNPQWEAIRNRQNALDGVFAFGTEPLNISPAGEIRVADGLWVSGAFFQTLGIQPVAGRLFATADDRRGCGLPGVVISYAFWQREFAGDPRAVGRTIAIQDIPAEVVGVTPQGFSGLDVGRTFDIALLLCSEPMLRPKASRLDRGTVWWLIAMGRLKPGSQVEQAAAQVATLSAGVFEATLPANYPTVSVKTYLNFRLTAAAASTGFSGLRADYSLSLCVLLAISGLVLLIACANLANLMLARASARQREMAVRLAIGASRGRMIRHLLAESLLLAIAGAAAGLALAGSLSRFLITMLETKLDLSPDWRVFGFTAALAILTCLLFGLAPALRATRTNAGEALKSGSRGSSHGRESFRMQRMLVAAQVALCLVLVSGALLFARSLRNLATLDAGFRPNGVLITSVSFRKLNLPNDRILGFRRELIEKIAAIPGVDSVTDANQIPISGSGTSNTVWLDGEDAKKGAETLLAGVGTGYFKTLGMPLLAGRDFEARDVPGAPRVAIVNETLARKLTAGNPVGRRFRVEATPSTPETAYEIVGVTRDSKYRELREDPAPQAFLALAQDPQIYSGDQVLLHSSLGLEQLIPSIKKTLAMIDPELRFSFRVLTSLIDGSLMRERLMATLSGFFGALAGLLAAIGLYGVISYTVARRTNEIGIRMALGAARADVLRLVLREVALLCAMGTAVGVALALAGGTAVRSLLYGLQPYDPATLGMAAGVLLAIALAASYVPAWRAARLDPMRALRHE